MAVKINKIEIQTVELFDPNGKSLGFVNSYEFNDVRIQIKKQQLEGYYCLFEGVKHEIQKNGRLNYWPEGLFDLFEKQLMQLI